MRLTKTQHEAMIGGEIIDEVRRVAEDVTGGNCAFADSDVKLLGRLAALACKAGLHNELTDLSLYTRRHIDKRYGLGVFSASCDRNPKGEKPQALSAEHESAVVSEASETPIPDHSSETPVE